MKQEDLEVLVEAGLSQRHIAKKLGVACSSVWRWLNKYGIKTKYKVIGVELDSLQLLIEEGLPHREIAKRLGCGTGPVQRAMRVYGLKTKHQPRIKISFACTGCGTQDTARFYKRKEYRCILCLRKDALVQRAKYKRQLVDYKGGCCQECGYKKCMASLQFHHIDPTQKDPDWIKLRRRPLAEVKSELDKCMLVCSNCHGEIHSGEEWKDVEVRV